MYVSSKKCSVQLGLYSLHCMVSAEAPEPLIFNEMKFPDQPFYNKQGVWICLLASETESIMKKCNEKETGRETE